MKRAISDGENPEAKRQKTAVDDSILDSDSQQLIANLTSENEALKSQNAELKKKIATYQNVNSELAKEVARLRKQITELQKSVDNLQPDASPLILLQTSAAFFGGLTVNLSLPQHPKSESSSASPGTTHGVRA